MISDAGAAHRAESRSRRCQAVRRTDFVDISSRPEWLGVNRTRSRAHPCRRTASADPEESWRKRAPDYPVALDDLTTYVNAVIPWPSTGASTGESPVPGTERTADRRRLFTVNAHNVELVHAPLPNSGFRVIPTSTRGHSSGGSAEPRHRAGELPGYKDAASIFVPLGAMAELLERKSILVAARRIALGSCAAGRRTAKFHSDDLLDKVLLHREETTGA